MGGASDQGTQACFPRDPSHPALLPQGAAGTGLPGGDLLFELLVFLNSGESLGHDRPPVRTCKATHRDGPLEGRDVLMARAVQSLCTRVTERRPKPLGAEEG